jgi:arabinogalactan oligomer/maltooligosaccharide transport system permease protein
VTTSAVPEMSAKRRARATAETRSVRGILITIAVLSVFDAIALFGVMTMIANRSYIFAIVTTVITVIINWVYLRPGGLPQKYLLPGVIFMAIFQVYVVGFMGFISLTNYGTQHNSTKDNALTALLLNGQLRVDDAPIYDLTVVEDSSGDLAFLVTAPGAEPRDVFVGRDLEPLRSITPLERDNRGTAIAADGFRTLAFDQIRARQQELLAMKVPLTADESFEFFLMTPDARSAIVYTPRLDYDPVADTMTRVDDGKVFADRGRGIFTADDGETIAPGWRVIIGFDNFVRAVTEPRIRTPFLKVTIWTFTFAAASVFLTFALGLALAILLNDKRIRGLKWYRAIIILPYAFPAFLSAFVWRAMFNEKYGFINQVVLGGAEIPWLTDEWLARGAVIMLNLWLGFPYMFLISTGALQAIPEELSESARVDGASPWQQFRLIKLPLLLVSLAPLLITSFAFNFNNFGIIYLLTGGGPRDLSAGMNVGATDILITMVYKIAFETGVGRDYGLASAFSILIFLIVGTISIVSFRQTKALEDMNR